MRADLQIIERVPVLAERAINSDVLSRETNVWVRLEHLAEYCDSEWQVSVKHHNPSCTATLRFHSKGHHCLRYIAQRFRGDDALLAKVIQVKEDEIVMDIEGRPDPLELRIFLKA